MRFKNKQLPLAILLALMVIVRAHAQENTPLETIRIDTNLVVLRIAVNDKQGLAIQNLKQGAFKVYEDGVQQDVSSSAQRNRP